MQISLTPLGMVRTDATENEVRFMEREIEGELEIFEEFSMPHWYQRLMDEPGHL